MFEGMNRFLSVHALGFIFYNLVHMTNMVVNGIPERFPKLKLLWIESGLAWIPFLMQRLDNEYMMRSSEAPLLQAACRASTCARCTTRRSRSRTTISSCSR